MKRGILAVLLLVLFLVATAAPAFAQPSIGGAPPGNAHLNGHAVTNHGADTRTEPTTGGKSPHFA